MDCKKCNESEKIIKNGYVRQKQRFLCKACGYNFTEGDGRIRHENTIKRAFCILLYTLGNGTFNFLGKLFNVSAVTVYKWIRKEAELLPNPSIPKDMKEVELDEMWHFIRSKKSKNGYSKPLIAVQGEPLPGLQAVVMLKQSGSSMRN